MEKPSVIPMERLESMLVEMEALARRPQSLLAKLPSEKQENLSIARNARKKLRRSHLSKCD